MIHRSPLVRALTAVSGVVGALTYSAFLFAPLGPSRLSLSWSFPSELEAAGQPYSAWFRLADAVSGLLILATLAGLHHLGEINRVSRQARLGAVALASAGVASVTDSVTTMSCAPSLSASCRAKDESVTGLLGQTLQPHTLSGLVGFLGAAGGMVLIGFVVRNRATAWGTAGVTLGFTLAAVGLIDVGLLVLHGPFGLAERARAVLVSVWLLGAAVFVARPGRPRRPRSPHRDGQRLTTRPRSQRRGAGADRRPASRRDGDRVG